MRGEVEFDNALLGDFVIVRNDGVPLYHFAVVVDDEAMEITDVIRGEDHLSNTPKHIALIRALGYREPRFGHIPLILNADRTKMSKRKSQMAISAYREEGYLPEALVNFLAFLGWSPGTEEEIFTLDELAARFEIGKVHQGGAVFDKDRLDHLNGVYIRAMTDEQLALRLRAVGPGGGRATTTCCAWCRSSRSAWCKLGDVDDAHRLRVGARRGRRQLVRARAAARRRRAVPRTLDARSRSRAATLAELDDADFSADLLEQRCRAGRRGGRHEGRRLLLADPGRGHRPHRLAAALRVARAARPRAIAWPASTTRSASCAGVAA